ncbi:MAG TPA: hypothetical protein DCS93_09550 [Microscillaceae bacterium]|nr:hypothetical protein [Microscillaceae bacterium]
MKNLFQAPGNYTPYVSFNQTGKFEIKGESNMEYPQQFFEPIFDWLEKFIAESKLPIQFDIKMRYYNTGTSRTFFEILSLLEKSEVPVAVNWYASSRDTDMIDDGDGFQEDFPSLNFNVIIQREVAYE